MSSDMLFFVQIVLFVLLASVLLISAISLFIKPAKRTIRASLVDSSNGHIIDISQSETSIGRAKTCDIVFSDISVSRFHAVLSKRSNGWLIFDTHSTGGVIVNGKKIEKKSFLKDGDNIRFGKKEMIFYSTAVTTRQQMVKKTKRQDSDSTNRYVKPVAKNTRTINNKQKTNQDKNSLRSSNMKDRKTGVK